jgi:hypothetical protein
MQVAGLKAIKVNDLARGVLTIMARVYIAPLTLTEGGRPVARF